MPVATEMVSAGGVCASHGSGGQAPTSFFEFVPDGAVAQPGSAGRASQDAAMHYACYVCGVCVGTSQTLLEIREEVVVFSHLYAAERGERAGTKTIFCPGCETALGARGEGAVLLRQDRLLKKTERLEILVCSLKHQEISDLTPMLQDVFPHSNVSSRVLLKAELRGFELKGHRPAPDFVVVIHRNEGRALLTDRNGFYHDALGSAWQQTRGNVLLVLSRAEPKVDTDLFDQQLVRALSTQGDQPTVGALGALGRVLTWGSSPSALQARHLQMLAAKAYYREPAMPAQGIPLQWARQSTKTSAATVWSCGVL